MKGSLHLQIRNKIKTIDFLYLSYLSWLGGGGGVFVFVFVSIRGGRRRFSSPRGSLYHGLKPVRVRLGYGYGYGYGGMNSHLTP